MYYTYFSTNKSHFKIQVILARKGPLGKIWLAAHWDKKLTKTQIFSTDISESVEKIVNPAAPLALRVSGHLMLGIVRIYSRKVKYLMSDCAEAMWKMKMAFRPGNIDMSEAAMIAQTNLIDDARFFGQVQPDYDYPDLSDMAFEQNILSQYEDIRSSRHQLKSGDDRETTQSFDKFYGNFGSVTSSPSKSIFDSRLSEINIPDMSFDGRNSDIDKRSNRSSDIEMVRGNISSHYSFSAPGRSSGASSHMSHFVEDDIPAFNDQENFYTDMAPELGKLRDLNDAIGEIEHPLTPLYVDEHSGVDNNSFVPPKRKINSRKRQKIVVDERVELSGNFYKQILIDKSVILRRRPIDVLVSNAKPGVALNKFIVPNSRGTIIGITI